jgi:hypothetical protein
MEELEELGELAELAVVYYLFPMLVYIVARKPLLFPEPEQLFLHRIRLPRPRKAPYDTEVA